MTLKIKHLIQLYEEKRLDFFNVHKFQGINEITLYVLKDGKQILETDYLDYDHLLKYIEDKNCTFILKGRLDFYVFLKAFKAYTYDENAKHSLTMVSLIKHDLEIKAKHPNSFYYYMLYVESKNENLKSFKKDNDDYNVIKHHWYGDYGCCYSILIPDKLTITPRMRNLLKLKFGYIGTEHLAFERHDIINHSMDKLYKFLKVASLFHCGFDNMDVKNLVYVIFSNSY